MKPTRLLPDDRGLPGLVAIRSAGLVRTMIRLGLGDAPLDLEQADAALGAYRKGSGAGLHASGRRPSSTPPPTIPRSAERHGRDGEGGRPMPFAGSPPACDAGPILAATRLDTDALAG